MADTPEPQVSILDQLIAIHAEANTYFDEAIESLTRDGVDWSDEPRWSWPTHRVEQDYFAALAPEHQEAARRIAGKLAALAQQTAPAIRRAPFLTEADEREAGHAFKGMRASLRFREFQFEDIEVLHDEGTVLGVQPARESEPWTIPPDAKKSFGYWSDSLKERLELTDLYPLKNDDVRPASSRPIAAGYRPGTAFIMMWISEENPELEDICNKIKECFRRFDIVAVRADDIEHEEVITKKILDEISTSEFLIADITGERPSVYYEIGYAHALGRRVSMYRKAGTRIHFDLAAHNCPEYKNASQLDEMLMKRLETLTGGPPKTP